MYKCNSGILHECPSPPGKNETATRKLKTRLRPVKSLVTAKP